jgi:hypothetical protein
LLNTSKHAVLPEKRVGDMLAGAILWALGSMATGVQGERLRAEPKEPNPAPVPDTYEEIQVQRECLGL